MTQRYAHLRDDALKRAADVAGDIIGGIANGSGTAQVDTFRAIDHMKVHASYQGLGIGSGYRNQRQLAL
jgi:GNAT superfamily N-acetyltransferase